MMRPPCGCWVFMMRNASWVQRKAPVEDSYQSRISIDSRSGQVLSSAPEAEIEPALLKSRSSRPKVSSGLGEERSCTWKRGLVTSVGTGRARRPPGVRRHWLRAASRRAGSRKLRGGAWARRPRQRRRSSLLLGGARERHCLPIPLPAPVTMATFCAESDMPPHYPQHAVVRLAAERSAGECLRRRQARVWSNCADQAHRQKDQGGDQSQRFHWTAIPTRRKGSRISQRIGYRKEREQGTSGQQKIRRRQNSRRLSMRIPLDAT